MKKRLCIFLFIVLAIAGSVDAQMEYSVNVGFNGSNFYSDPHGEILSENHYFGALGMNCWIGYGLNIGVGLSYDMNEKFSFEQNIQLNQSDYQMSFDILRANPFKFGSSRTNIKITNLDLISELNWNPFAKVKLGIGIYSGIKIHQDIEDFTFRADGILLETVKTNLNLFELGLSSVLSYSIWKINLKLRYMHGLSRSLRHSYIDDGITVFDNRRRSRTFQLSLGYTF